jgi:Ca2+-binding EF-hand superfamily protein
MDRRARMNREKKAKQKAAMAKVAQQQAHQKAIEDKHNAKKAELEKNAGKHVGLVESDSEDDDDESSSSEEEAVEETAAEEEGEAEAEEGDEQGGVKLPAIDKKLEAKKALLAFQKLANPGKKKTAKQLAKEEAERKKQRLKKEREEREKLDPKDAAYQAFSMIDADGSGRVTVRELARYISGQLIDTFDCRFPVADTGMTFANDKDGNIIVKDMESGSPADVHPDMDPGLRVLLLNGQSFGQTKNGRNIKDLKKFLKTITEGADIVFTFKEPAFVCGEYSCYIELQVEGSDEIHTLQMEDRAYPDASEFIELVNKQLQEVEELKFIYCYFLADEERVVLRSTDELKKFRFMGETGPNSNASCHSIMGFGVSDTALTDEAVGLPKSMDLKMGLSIEDTKTIAQELMDLYDKNDNNLFEFDEFCDLYNVYLLSDEHEDKLRKYARHKFRTPEQIEAERYARRYKRMMDKRNRKLLESRAKNKMIEAQQKEKRRHMYYRDEDGNFRKHTAQMLDQIEASEHHKEMEKNSWMGIFKTTKKPQKKKPDGSTRKLVGMTAAKLLRKAGLRKEPELAAIDASKGRNKAIDVVQARLQKEERDPQKVLRRKQMEYRKKKALKKIQRERDAAREAERMEKAEDEKIRHQMAENGMEELMGGEKVTGADVAHPAWLGFIPLRRREKMDPASRSPVHFNMRAMRPDKEPPPHIIHDYVHKLVHGPERFRAHDKDETGKRYHQLKEELAAAEDSLHKAEASGDHRAIELETKAVEELNQATHEAHDQHKRALPPKLPERPVIDESSDERLDNFGAGAQVHKRRVWASLDKPGKLKPGKLIKIRVKDADPEVPTELKLCRVVEATDDSVTAVLTFLDKSDLEGTGGVGSLEDSDIEITAPLSDVVGELDQNVWIKQNWDWMADWDLKPAWMEEERLTVSEVAAKAYRKRRDEIPAPGADPDDPEKVEKIRILEEIQGITETIDSWTWGEKMWEFVSKPKPEWMVDAKSIANNAKAEQELERHNRGLREKSSAAVAEASQKKKKKLPPKRLSAYQKEEEKKEGALEHAEMIRRKRQAWTVYPSAPIGAGKTKQEYPHFSEQYDTGEIVHPSCYGYVVAGGSDHPRFIHPAFKGYELRRAPMSDVPLKRQELFFRMRKGDKMDACPVCLSAKIGCPYCWEFPADWDPVDFEYKGPKVPLYGAEEPEFKLHTNKVTENSLKMLRHMKTDHVELFIRTIPAGLVFRTIVEPDCTIGYLHFLHRSNTPFGNQPHQVLVIPTMKGMYFMDNELKPETDLALGVFTTDDKLHKYGLKRDESRVVLLHYHYYDQRNMVRPLQHFIEHNTYMGQQPEMEIFHKLESSSKMDELISKDFLQKELLQLFELQYEKDRIRDHQDVEVQRKELWEKAHADAETKKWLELKEHRAKVNEAYFKKKAEMGLKRKSGATEDEDVQEAGGFILAVMSHEEGITKQMRGYVVEKCNLLKGGQARGITHEDFIVEKDELEAKLLEFQNMCKEFDETGHGYFTVEHFQDICNNMYGKEKKDKRWTLEAEWDPEMDAEQMAQVMQLADPDGSGEVYYEPFVQAMGMSVSDLKADMKKNMVKALQQQQRAKESALKLKPEVLASPQVASNATTSQKLHYHLRVPGLSNVQRQLQHVLAMETQLYDMTHAVDEVQVTTLNPKAIKKMEDMIAEVKGDLKHMQGTSMSRKNETIEDILDMHRLEDKVWKIQNTIQKAYATKAAAIKKALEPKPEEYVPTPEEIQKKKDEEEAERQRKEAEPEPISMGSLDDGPVRYLGQEDDG